MTVLAAQPERFWELDGCCNFRDVGGYTTATGATLQPRRLFRSDSLSAASPDDISRLRALNLATVIDLRSTHEIALAGRYRDDTVTYHHLPFGDLLATETNWEGWSDPAYVADRYFDVCRAAEESVVEALAILTDPSTYPVVIHCSMGKDRTGVLVALVLRALGMSSHDVACEHGLSRLGAQRRVERLRLQMGEDRDDLDPYLPALLAADPDTMQAFLRRVCAEFGSVRQYLRRLGILSSVDYLRAALLD